jgi:hypothetical protein
MKSQLSPKNIIKNNLNMVDMHHIISTSFQN